MTNKGLISRHFSDKEAPSIFFLTKVKFFLSDFQMLFI